MLTIANQFAKERGLKTPSSSSILIVASGLEKARFYKKWIRWTVYSVTVTVPLSQATYVGNLIKQENYLGHILHMRQVNMKAQKSTRSMEDGNKEQEA